MKTKRSVTMPVDYTLEAVTIVAWHKNIGDNVTKGELLVEVETGKTSMDIESPVDGTLVEICKQDGEEILREEHSTGSWHATFCYIETEEHVAVEEPKKEQIVLQSDVLIAAPYVRKIAQEKGIDLVTIKGSGPRGAITLQDVEAKDSKKSIEKTDSFLQPLSSLHLAVARNMTKSWKIPHAYTGVQIDFRRLLLAKESIHSQYIRPDVLVMYFMVLELKDQFHNLNSCVECEASEIIGLKIFNHIHLGVAYDQEDGIIIPPVRNVEECDSIVDFADRYIALSKKVAAGKLTMAELSGATITFNNVGAFRSDTGVSFGADDGASIVPHGQSVIVTLHRIGSLQDGPNFGFAMLRASFDHRAHSRGKPIIHFLNKIKQHIENFDYDGFIRSL